MQSKSDKITKVSLIRLQDKFEDSEDSKLSSIIVVMTQQYWANILFIKIFRVGL